MAQLQKMMVTIDPKQVADLKEALRQALTSTTKIVHPDKELLALADEMHALADNWPDDLSASDVLDTFADRIKRLAEGHATAPAREHAARNVQPDELSRLREVLRVLVEGGSR